jgi:Fur family ferric uptake transcriptional regulator
MVRKRLPKISLGTVYRNLEMLTQKGLIQKLETVGNQKRFDGNVMEHSHIRCLHCGKIDDLDAEPQVDIRETIRQIKQYELIGYWIECLGICDACREKEESGEVA